MLTDTMQLDDLKPYLWMFGLTVVGDMGGTMLVTDSKTLNHVVWGLCDNGGEISVWPINRWEKMRSVPTHHSVPGFLNPDEGTACYRIRCAVDGRAIDYKMRMSVVPTR